MFSYDGEVEEREPGTLRIILAPGLLVILALLLLKVFPFSWITNTRITPALTTKRPSPIPTYGMVLDSHLEGVNGTRFLGFDLFQGGYYYWLFNVTAGKSSVSLAKEASMFWSIDVAAGGVWPRNDTGVKMFTWSPAETGSYTSPCKIWSRRLRERFRAFRVQVVGPIRPRYQCRFQLRLL